MHDANIHRKMGAKAHKFNFIRNNAIEFWWNWRWAHPTRSAYTHKCGFCMLPGARLILRVMWNIQFNINASHTHTYAPHTSTCGYYGEKHWTTEKWNNHINKEKNCLYPRHFKKVYKRELELLLVFLYCHSFEFDKCRM